MVQGHWQGMELGQRHGSVWRSWDKDMAMDGVDGFLGKPHPRTLSMPVSLEGLSPCYGLSPPPPGCHPPLHAVTPLSVLYPCSRLCPRSGSMAMARSMPSSAQLCPGAPCSTFRRFQDRPSWLCCSPLSQTPPRGHRLLQFLALRWQIHPQKGHTALQCLAFSQHGVTQELEGEQEALRGEEG